MKKRIFTSIVLLLAGFLLYHLLFGRLMAFSPIVIGFEKHKTGNAEVYYHKHDKGLNSQTLDSLIVAVEQFHQLNFNKGVRIFICRTNREFKRYTGSSARFVTILGGAIFMSAQANEERKTNSIHLNTYLGHELSHLLLYQNMSLKRALDYPQWFMEGLAVYSSNQFGRDGYPTQKETYREISKGNFVQPKDWGTAFSSKGPSVKTCQVPHKYKFIYSEFGCIIDDLITIYGKDTFLKFMKQSLHSTDFYALFQQTYGKTFSKYKHEFETRVTSS